MTIKMHASISSLFFLLKLFKQIVNIVCFHVPTVFYELHQENSLTSLLYK